MLKVIKELLLKIIDSIDAGNDDDQAYKDKVQKLFK